MNALLRADELALDRVARALRLGGGFAVVVCRDGVRQAATAYLRRATRRKTHRRVISSGEEAVARLSRAPAAGDLELWAIEPARREEVWTALNLHREKLLRNGRHVVLWASGPDEAGALARWSPDLWSFRATTAEVDGMPEVSVRRLDRSALLVAEGRVRAASGHGQKVAALASLLQVALVGGSEHEILSVGERLEALVSQAPIPQGLHIGVRLLLAESMRGDVARRAALENALADAARLEGGGAAAAWLGPDPKSRRESDDFVHRALAVLPPPPVIGTNPQTLLGHLHSRLGATELTRRLAVLALGQRGAVQDAMCHVPLIGGSNNGAVPAWLAEWTGLWRRGRSDDAAQQHDEPTDHSEGFRCWTLLRRGEITAAKSLLDRVGPARTMLEVRAADESKDLGEALELARASHSAALDQPAPQHIMTSLTLWMDLAGDADISHSEVAAAIATAEARSIEIEGDVHAWHSISYGVLAGTFACSHPDTWAAGRARLETALELARREWDDYVPWVVRHIVWVGLDREDPAHVRALAAEALPLADVSYQRRQEVAVLAGLACLPDASVADLDRMHAANERAGHAVLHALSLLAVGRHARAGTIDRSALLEDAAARFATFPWPAKEAEALHALGRHAEARMLLETYGLRGSLRRLERGFPGLPDFS